MKIGFTLLLLFVALDVAPAGAQTQPQVLAELFCSFGCSNCPSQDTLYDAFVASHPSAGIVVINYHNNIATNDDPFYLQAQADVYQREQKSYYNVIGDPTGFINGYNYQNSAALWINQTTQDYTSYPLSPINPNAELGTDGLIHIKFSATGPPTSKGSGLVRVALKESQIVYQNTDPDGYGNPPGDVWNDIFRAMLPNSSDTTPLAAGQTRTFDVVFDPNNFNLYSSLWNIQNMTAVVFVQDVADDGTGNYDVESIGVVSLAGASGVTPPPSSGTSLRVAGSPSHPELIVSLANSNMVSIQITDLLGRAVRTIPEVNMPSGETTVDLSGIDLATGGYFARLLLDGQDAANAKFIAAP